MFQKSMHFPVNDVRVNETPVKRFVLIILALAKIQIKLNVYIVILSYIKKRKVIKSFVKFPTVCFTNLTATYREDVAPPTAQLFSATCAADSADNTVNSGARVPSAGQTVRQRHF